MIDSFSGENAFLSNFCDALTDYEGITYMSSEAAFQAAKTLNITERRRIAKMTPSEAKKAGRNLKLRPDWEEVKDRVMYDVCLAKFGMDRPYIRRTLLATGDKELVEGNTWHDNYWGNCICDKCKNIPGRNQLGKTLMKLREDIREGRV